LDRDGHTGMTRDSQTRLSRLTRHSKISKLFLQKGSDFGNAAMTSTMATYLQNPDGLTPAIVRDPVPPLPPSAAPVRPAQAWLGCCYRVSSQLCPHGWLLRFRPPRRPKSCRGGPEPTAIRPRATLGS
jgi:hypothetical protein